MGGKALTCARPGSCTNLSSLNRPILFLLLQVPAALYAADSGSQCYGSTANGRIEHAVQLPADGANFQAYSTLARLLDRTWVHSTVRDIVVGAYRRLQTSQPGKVFKYAETGFAGGGPFKPHKTHQNGLSVDFTVPVLDSQGRSVYLPTHALNRYGYDVEFDSKGAYDDYRIDFDALAAHLVALHKEARQRGVDLWRVILDPGLQPYLLQTADGAYIRRHIRLSKRPSWVRHDDHYHVDFAIPCQKLEDYR